MLIEEYETGCVVDDGNTFIEDGVGTSKQLKFNGEVITPRLETPTSGGIFTPKRRTFDSAVIH